MAAIVQSNPYNCLIRKIGYSVGLESVSDRIKTLTEIYVKDKKLNYSVWEYIVREKYGLSGSKSVEHVGNYFSSINIIKIYNKDLTTLFGLDILSILRRYFSDDFKFNESVNYILTFLILEADGDIFLNCLSSSFDKAKIKHDLIEMISAKRSAIKKAITNQEILKNINSILDIKQQRQSNEDKNSIFGGRNSSPFEVRKDPLYGQISDEILISDDYLKKVPQTRKGWAQDLGLYDNNKITYSGHRLLAELSCLNLCTPNGAYVFWPYQQELASIFINPNDIGIPPLERLDILSCLSSSKNEINKEEFDPVGNYSDVINTITDIYKLYKLGDVDKGKIRHQLPLYVLFPVLFAINYVENKNIVPILEILDREYKSRERLINKISIAGTEGAIFIKNS